MNVIKQLRYVYDGQIGDTIKRRNINQKLLRTFFFRPLADHIAPPELDQTIRRQGETLLS
jgi:hypothetical protein